jgi:DNA mismatch repair ATPase MutS
MLDRTSTGPGSRLLFSNILAPPNKCGTIEMRQEAVQELCFPKQALRRVFLENNLNLLKTINHIFE